MKLNLIFHLYPKQGSIWRWHVARLIERRHAWNGRRLVTVAVDGTTDPEVLRELEPLEAECRVVANDPHIGETRYFPDALTQLESLDPGEATFYAHAKGVSRKPEELSVVLSWAAAMYQMNLGSMDLIRKLLARYDSVGAFRFPTSYPGAAWYYSGTFFWLRHDAVFKTDWRTLRACRHAVEAFPGSRIPVERSFDLTAGKPHSPYTLKTTRAECETWLREVLAREMAA